MNKLLLLIGLCLFLINSLNAQVAPVQNGDKYSLTVGDVFIEVDASFGARITSFKKGDKEILIQTHSGGMLGSTLWTSPQDEWGWPTLETTDLDAYSVDIEDDKMIFTSGVETGISGRKFKFIKTFSGNKDNNSISIRYALENVGTRSFSNSLWSVTRVDPEGLTFWRTGNIDPWDSKKGQLVDKMVEAVDYTWLDFDLDNGTGLKFFADIGEANWFAHITDDNYLFIKSTPDVVSNDFAPGEAELEYWVDGGAGYIELENQSKYSEIEVGETLIYDVKWHLHKLADDVVAEVGNEKLIELVQSIVENDKFTGISDAVVLNKILVYPNPVKDVLTVNLDGLKSADFKLYNLSGRMIFLDSVIDQEQILLDELKMGAYFYQIITANKTYSGKLIKQ